jgi:hypothetical protein
MFSMNRGLPLLQNNGFVNRTEDRIDGDFIAMSNITGRARMQSIVTHCKRTSRENGKGTWEEQGLAAEIHASTEPLHKIGCWIRNEVGTLDQVASKT